MRINNVSGFERRLDARLVVSIVAVGIMSFAGEAVETAMNVAFPALMGEFGVNTATVQWVTTGYLLVLSAIMPISSFLNRRFRARTLFLAAMLTFLAGTIMSAAAPHFSLLIGGRILQGVGTGVGLPLMFNIVLQQVPYERMGTMMGLATLITAIAPAVGPSLGGFLIGALGWRSIFLVLVPFLVIALVLGALTIRQAQETRRVSFAPSSSCSWRPGSSPSSSPPTLPPPAHGPARRYSGCSSCPWRSLPVSSCSPGAPTIPCCACGSSPTAPTRRASSTWCSSRPSCWRWDT